MQKKQQTINTDKWFKEPDHFIYTLLNPITNKVFYIGITYETIHKRLKRHISKSKELKNKVHLEIQAIINTGSTPTVELLDIVTGNEYVRNRTSLETYWICQFRAWGFELANERLYL